MKNDPLRLRYKRYGQCVTLQRFRAWAGLLSGFQLWNNFDFPAIGQRAERGALPGKFDRYISHEERDKFLAALITESNLIEPTESVHGCRDPEDNQILELAVNGNAAYIVTGDIDLLVLNPFRGAQIVTPAEFLKHGPDQEP